MGAEALVGFLQQFGNPDIYTKTFLEVLFEELIYDSYEEVELDGNETTLPVSRQERQDGDQASIPSPRSENDCSDNGCQTT